MGRCDVLGKSHVGLFKKSLLFTVSAGVLILGHADPVNPSFCSASLEILLKSIYAEALLYHLIKL